MHINIRNRLYDIIAASKDLCILLTPTPDAMVNLWATLLQAPTVALLGGILNLFRGIILNNFTQQYNIRNYTLTNVREEELLMGHEEKEDSQAVEMDHISFKCITPLIFTSVDLKSGPPTPPPSPPSPCSTSSPTMDTIVDTVDAAIYPKLFSKRKSCFFVIEYDPESDATESVPLYPYEGHDKCEISHRITKFDSDDDDLDYDGENDANNNFSPEDDGYDWICADPLSTGNPRRERRFSDCGDDFIFFELGSPEVSWSTNFRSKDLKTNEDSDDDSQDLAGNSTKDLESFKGKKVRFNLKPKIHVMHAWDFAYRKARKGCWEQYSRDRSRFQRRIERTAEKLDPILDLSHRNNIYKQRFADLL